jgi:metal-responsive CopG/Arc/MetJ family transcriptional regulator
MNDRITIRLDPDIVEALEKFLVEEDVNCRSRQDAFRYIVRDWLTESGYLGQQPSKKAVG